MNISLTANDKLSTLSIVGTGYRSLIYELKLDAGFETLSSGCLTILKALEENPNLPKLLVSQLELICMDFIPGHVSNFVLYIVII